MSNLQSPDVKVTHEPRDISDIMLREVLAFELFCLNDAEATSRDYVPGELWRAGTPVLWDLYRTKAEMLQSALVAAGAKITVTKLPKLQQVIEGITTIPAKKAYQLPL